MVETTSKAIIVKLGQQIGKTWNTDHPLPLANTLHSANSIIITTYSLRNVIHPSMHIVPKYVGVLTCLPLCVYNNNIHCCCPNGDSQSNKTRAIHVVADRLRRLHTWGTKCIDR